MRYAAPEETFLLLHDFSSNFDNGALPLIHGLDEPVGVRHAIAEPGLGRLVLPKLCHIALVDEQAGQVCAVQFNRPPSAALRDINVRRHRYAVLAFKAAARFWIIAAKLNEHIAQILVIDAAHAFQLVKGAFGNQIQIADQPCHARVVTIRLLCL